MAVNHKKENKKRGRPSGAKSQLTSEMIMQCAKVLLQEEGKIPSIRKIAGTLEVDAMAIYHYYANKQALLAAVTVSLIEEIYKPRNVSLDHADDRGSEKHDSNWQLELKLLCKSYIQLLQKYPGLLETLLTMAEEGPAEIFAQRFEIALAPLNLDDDIQKDALDLLTDYLHGFALSMDCDKEGLLTVGMIDKPLRLYMRGLTASC